MGTPLRVLLVEDSEDDAIHVLRLLKRAGYDVTHERVDTADELGTALRDHPWDIVLSDHSMPGFSGLAALAMLQQHDPDLPFIFVSGTIGEEAAVTAMKTGASDYVLKGNLTRLVPAVQRELRDAEVRMGRRQADLALHASEERYRHLFDGSPLPLWVYDLENLRFLDVNQVACEKYGYSREEFLAMTIRDIRPPGDIPQLVKNLRGADPAGVATGIWRHVLRDGTLIDVQVTSHEIELKGRRSRLVCPIDVTAQLRAERALRESERRFSNMLGNVQLLSVMLDRDARITYCNDYLLRLTGWRREEVLGRDWFEVFLDANSRQRGEFEIRKRDYAAMLENPLHTPHAERDLITRAGERRLIRWSHTLLRSATGEVSGSASIGEDITEQKLAEEKIKRLNRVYAVLSGINTLIVRTRDRDELYREACRIACELGRFRLAWIGVADSDKQSIEPVAWAGDEQGYLSLVRGLAGSTATLKQGLAASVIRSRRFMVCNDIEAQGEALQYRDEALRRGYLSVIALPLIVEDEVAGVLHLYAGERNLFDEKEIALLDGLAGDISFGLEHIGKSEKLEYLAYYDELTGLANSTLFRERVDQFLGVADREKKQLAIVVLNIERFRTINDTLGRQVGDGLLRQVAQRARQSIQDAHQLARIGGDYFAAVLPQVNEVDDAARRVILKYKEIFDTPFDAHGTELRVAARLGIAIFPDDGLNAESLLRNAEAALKNEKTSGERCVFYTYQMNERVAERLNLENKLRGALENEEFVLHYQPKVDLETRKLTGVEALIRWNDPLSGLVSPAQFIPLLEETGLILEVGVWALRRAVLDYGHWVQAGLAAPRIAVNVSPLQLRQRDFVDVVKAAVALGASPPGIDLEITESLIMEDVEGNIAKLKQIRDMGITIFIDDFGTGYSSLGYLAKLPVQTLKIDRSFVITMLTDPNTMSLVSTIISLAHSLKLKVVAEGVDKEEQATILRLLRCEEMQGYLFSKPLQRDEISALLRAPA